MTEKYEDANSIMSDLESQMALANLIKRGEYAAGIAVLSGDILKSAVAAGVPYAMAEEMAGDFWKAEMLADTVAALLRDSDLEEDDQ
jgi:glycerol-3-phosphate acyltransferase PlsY